MTEPTVSIIERKAFGIAACNFLTISDETMANDPYLAYVEFRDAVVEERELEYGLGVWAPFADTQEKNEILGNLDDLAHHIMQEMKETLELAKAGIVHETIEARLDSDMNALDMTHLASVGVQLSA